MEDTESSAQLRALLLHSRASAFFPSRPPGVLCLRPFALCSCSWKCPASPSLRWLPPSS